MLGTRGGINTNLQYLKENVMKLDGKPEQERKKIEINQFLAESFN